MASTQQARSAAERLVGPLEVVADLSWTIDQAVVLDVVLADGTRAVVKQHLIDGHHATEVEAYERWVPSIGERAPALLAHGEGVVVLSRLDGSPEVPLTVDVHADAGALARRFHDSEPPTPGDGWLDDRVARLEWWIAKAPPGLLSDDDVAWARAEVAVLRDLPPPPLVPVHGDYQPRNWLWDGSRVLVFDFERAARAWWIHDLNRMAWREWLDRDDLRSAFLGAYGRELDEVEQAGLRGLAALGHLSTIVWATEVGDLPFAAEGRARLDRARGIG